MSRWSRRDTALFMCGYTCNNPAKEVAAAAVAAGGGGEGGGGGGGAEDGRDSKYNVNGTTTNDNDNRNTERG